MDGDLKSISGRYSSLCFPDEEKSCFGCCPPIRPAGYDHLEHRLFLRRELLDNTKSIQLNTNRGRSIIGFSCWGLGYLNDHHIGCLLHPRRNHGRDLRDLTGYGDKCRRELCREAVAFSGLTSRQSRLVLCPADGLDSFEYSSRQTNPVFRLLRWGVTVIDALSREQTNGFDRSIYNEKWRMLARDLEPEIYRYPMEIWLDHLDISTLASPDVLNIFKQSTDRFIIRHRPKATPPLDNRPFVHQLNLPKGFTSFLRSGLGINRLKPSEARLLLDELSRSLTVSLFEQRRDKSAF